MTSCSLSPSSSPSGSQWTLLQTLDQAAKESLETVHESVLDEVEVEQFLPLGTAVRIHHRIPDGPHSLLRVQATIVMRAEEGSGDTIPQEYINTFSPSQTRAALAVSFIVLFHQILFKLSL